MFGRTGLVISPAEIERLIERTEGWAAGLRLAALSFEASATSGHGQPKVSDLVAQFVGDEQTVVDYLVDEVLAGMPEADRDFLLRTSVVEQVCADLAQVLSGRTDGQRLLENLERANAFVVAVGRRRIWFRYHQQLFREASVTSSGWRRRRWSPRPTGAASLRFSGRGEPIQALRHAIEALVGFLPQALAIHSLLPHILGLDRGQCG